MAIPARKHPGKTDGGRAALPKVAPPNGTAPPRVAPRRVVRGLTWLYPGMRVKRWLALIPVGLLLGICGVMVLFNLETLDLLDRLAFLV